MLKISKIIIIILNSNNLILYLVFIKVGEYINLYLKNNIFYIIILIYFSIKFFFLII